jgi:hypothetical protein
MKKVYVIGSLGGSGCPVNRAGGRRFDALADGEFTSFRRARAAAAELARMWARDDAEGVCSLAIAQYALDADGDQAGYGDLVAECLARCERKTVRWDWTWPTHIRRAYPPHGPFPSYHLPA